jgi:hypothetical protein
MMACTPPALDAGSLDPKLGGGGDAQVPQQSPKPAGGGRSLILEGLKLLGITVQLLTI